MNPDVAAARSHIIRRPRLTRLLDEATARIILIVAPAGYGKTTLAREWLEVSGQRGVWYHGGPGSADVAALAIGVGAAAATVVPGADAPMRQRLAAVDSGDPDPGLLADLLAAGLQAWPEGLWLVIDDYHLASDTAAAEAFISGVALQSRARLLVTSRIRPNWASPRRLLYGEIRELGHSILAMTEDEAQEVLAGRSTEEIPGLIALADGWPAVIGLAALANDLHPPGEILPTPLYDFLAEEIFQALDPTTAMALTRLAASRVITADIIELLVGNGAAATTDEAVSRGLLARTASEARFLMHPLLKEFLDRRLRQRPSEVECVVRLLYEHFRQTEEWDEAFDLVERFQRPDLVVGLVEGALQPLLKQGRLQTLERWLSVAHDAALDEPILDLADAEVAFRRGAHTRALTLALRAAGSLANHPLAARAWNRAGQSASFLDRTQDALNAHGTAEKVARDSADLREALWGQFTALPPDRVDEAAEILSRLKVLADESAQTVLRIAHAEVSLAMRRATSLDQPFETLERAYSISDRCDDPFVRSAFLHSFSYASTLMADYDRAQKLLAEELAIVEANRFDFALPHAHHLSAAAAFGLRQFSKGTAALDRAAGEAHHLGDVHSSMNIAALRIRISLALGDVDHALATANQRWTRIPNPALWAEFRCSAALAQALTGNLMEALHYVKDLDVDRVTVEAYLLAACVRAIVAIQSDDRAASELTRRCVERALHTRNFDSFISSYRAFPGLLAVASSAASTRPQLTEIVRRGSDVELALKVAPAVAPPRPRRGENLSPREVDVLELVAQGLPNKEIASLLFISETTVKVHVRHILEKMGARSRTDAARRFAASEFAAPPTQHQPRG